MLLALLLSTTLTFAWLWFFVRRDRHPEPAWLLARTFGWGMFAWAVAAAFEGSFGHLPLPWLVLLLSAVAEEASKFLAASTATTEHAFDEPMDGLVYAVTAALGFALLENLTYTMGFGTHAAAWHALPTTLAHALFSAPQGYAFGGRYLRGGRWWRSRGLLLSIGLHFTFNGLLTGGADWLQLLALSAVTALMIALAQRYYLHFEAHARENPQTP
ncbi:Membrane proteinase PrsW, cleaves anti-sigma factor RsiW, M82 family [Deinococcus hopiensis KR-140]|uniref:Protease PrsW n=1 Tax=Deinococcus hopiensis KR-140 TaxID=695939 RepID=A0A1W1V8F9_9DEIO|nr:Membrane proteinase PrsW, cleaves anti-sigma factor RsiW, M82 family [Deinococcus hopiensis KR-140]